MEYKDANEKATDMQIAFFWIDHIKNPCDKYIRKDYPLLTP